MKNYRESVENAARANKIELSPVELDQLERELFAFEQWLEPLLKVDTAATEPLLYSHRAVNVFREDMPEDGQPELLQRAAASFKKGFYCVPAIIE